MSRQHMPLGTGSICLSRFLMLAVMFFLVLYMFGGSVVGIFLPW